MLLFRELEKFLQFPSDIASLKFVPYERVSVAKEDTFEYSSSNPCFLKFKTSLLNGLAIMIAVNLSPSIVSINFSIP